MKRLLLRARFAAFCRHVAASSRPIVLGPWRSEVGFEVLYWLPFLRAIRARYHWDRSRLIALGRGGSGAWYDTPQVADLYDVTSFESIRLHTWAAHQRQQSTKQFGVEDWERHAVALAAANLGVSRPIMVHPSWMYRLLAPYWQDEMAEGGLKRNYEPAMIPPPPLPGNITLPDTFVAMRLYARATMQPSEEVTLWARSVLARIAARVPVVLLQSGQRYDDHVDLLQGDGQRIVDLASVLVPATNLAVQSAVLGRASAFVGTYGGLAQLAVRMGIPTVAVYTEWQGTALAHVDLTQRLALATQTPFLLARPKDLERLEGWGVL